ncbi:hypothetical protein [Streptomyces megasporus]|uniref:hypothetical protein n=1 Tax=Streptomyces megasporus TaxID=44060 RepID=UPI0012FF313B|nr:hypothetical protein [Streptomyces megasporus]
MSVSQPEEAVTPPEAERKPEPGTGTEGTGAATEAASGMVVLGSADAPVCTDGVCAL